MRVLVSGGLGFIGSGVVRHLVRETPHEVLVLDKVTYAASEDALEEAGSDRRVRLVRADIADGATVSAVFATFRPDWVMHLAAETHVDRSIDAPRVFVQTNVVGTSVLLEAARAHWTGLAPAARRRFRFLHVSTDEVFGSLAEGAAPFLPSAPYAPRSPYAASKAAADHLAMAWFHTYGLPVLVSHGANTYGPWQFPEKLIPRIVAAALEGNPLPVYGDGSNQRDWLYVEDHVRALFAILERGTPGTAYSVGTGTTRPNLAVVEAIAAELDRMAPDARGPHASRITFVSDRPGHDLRYEMDGTASGQALGWHATHDFRRGLASTLSWYLAHRAWLARTRARYHGERLGTAA